MRPGVNKWLRAERRKGGTAERRNGGTAEGQKGGLGQELKIKAELKFR